MQPPAQYPSVLIRAFIDAGFVFLGDKSTAHKGAIKAAYTDFIAKLPACEQAILLETQTTNVVADQPFVQKMYEVYGAADRSRKILGFFRPRESFNQHGRRTWFHAAVWAPDSRGPYGMAVSAHEWAHRTNYMVGSRTRAKFDAPGSLWAQIPGWQAALKADLAVSADMPPQKWQPSPDVRGIYTLNAPYHGYVPLHKHLQYYPDPATHPDEAFAEIGALYSHMHARHHGKPQQIEAGMARIYPALWPLYRDHALPAVARYAAMLQNRPGSVARKAALK